MRLEACVASTAIFGLCWPSWTLEHKHYSSSYNSYQVIHPELSWLQSVQTQSLQYSTRGCSVVQISLLHERTSCVKAFCRKSWNAFQSITPRAVPRSYRAEVFLDARKNTPVQESPSEGVIAVMNKEGYKKVYFCFWYMNTNMLASGLLKHSQCLIVEGDDARKNCRSTVYCCRLAQILWWVCNNTYQITYSSSEYVNSP